MKRKRTIADHARWAMKLRALRNEFFGLWRDINDLTSKSTPFSARKIDQIIKALVLRPRSS